MAGRKEEQQKEFSFVTEQIVVKPKKRRWIRKIVSAAFLAVVFGVTAGIAFAIVLPYAQQRFHKDSREPITIPKDEPPTEPITQEPTTMELVTEATVEETSTTESLEEKINELINERGLTIDDVGLLYEALYSLVEQVNQSIVTVTSVESEVDWFNNQYESEGETSGLIFSKTSTELLILTDAKSIHSADDIRISLLDGTRFEAALKKSDVVSGIAVISVDTAQIPEELLQNLMTVPLGNSYTVKQGDFMIAVGNPLGYNYSMSYGVVASVKNTVQAVDSNYRLINTNILGSPDGCGFLLNTKGEVMGIITKEYGDDSIDTITTAIAISDLKVTLEKLSNGQDIIHFGIKGVEGIEEDTYPRGIFITEVVTDTPAYRAGLQSGDFLIAINDTEIYNMKSMRTALENCKPGETIQAVVLRKSRDEYKEIEFEVEFDSH